MKYSIWGFVLLITTCLQGATVTWDDEATRVINDKTEPDTRWMIKKNWAGDELPGPGDDVKLLIHGSADPIILSSSSAIVNTIESKVPFQIGSTLTITDRGTFEDSIFAGADGQIRANSFVTLKGQNSLNTTGLEGSGEFTNEGFMTLGSRGIHIDTRFRNQGLFTMVAGSTNLGIFSNEGTFDFGGRGIAGTSTDFTNRGTVRKDNPEEKSQFLGEWNQTEGKLSVGTDAELTMGGYLQSFNGGLIEADGTLNLQQISGGSPFHAFAGLTEIKGNGTVNQVVRFQLRENLTVAMPNQPGYALGDLDFGWIKPTTLTNTGFLSIGQNVTSPKLTDFAEADNRISFFINSENATVMQSTSSNPSFSVYVENAGTWTSYGMKIRSFENTGTLYLEGNTKQIDRQTFNDNFKKTLFNKGQVILGKDEFARHTIKTQYHQLQTATTHLKNGLLTLEGGSVIFAGTFKIDSSERLEITHGGYGRLNNPNITDGGGDSLLFKGLGTVIMGGSQLDPTISVTDLKNTLGVEGDSFIDDEKGFRMRTGSLFLTLLTNEGYMNWGGGAIRGSEFINKFRLDISAGAPRVLDINLKNSGPFNKRGTFPVEKSPGGTIIQTSSLTFSNGAGSSSSSGGSVENAGTHRLHPGASISGGPNTYLNKNLLICEDGASAAISVAFLNQGTVKVTGVSVLGFTNLKNLSESGILTGGNWEVDPDAEILLQTDIKVMLRTKWTGPGATTVTTIAEDSILTKTTDEVHSVKLEVAGTVLLGAGTKTTIPEVELKDDGYMRGFGELVGNLLVSEGTEAPGESVGTLTITGNTTFTSESTYEWEADSPTNSDLTQVNSGTATLAGTVRSMLIDGYIPQAETTFTILNAPTIVGTFDQVDDTALPSGMTATLAYTPTSVTITLDWAIELTSYDDWKAENFTVEEQADELISGPDADPDKDGLTNLQEYTFGTMPKTGNGVPVQMSDATDGYIELTFPWADGISDAYFQVELGNDLETFSPTPHTVVSSESTNGITQYVIRINISDTGTPGFVRLKTKLKEL